MGTPGGVSGLSTLYRQAIASLCASARLRRSLSLWITTGLVFTELFTLLVALLHGGDVAPELLLGFGWWLLVSAVLVGGIPLLLTEKDQRIEYLGVPNGLTTVRAWACLPLLLTATVTLPGHIGLILWCTLGGTAALLDLVDGVVARRLGPVTKLGKAMDPAMDAVFFSMAAVGSAALTITPAWLASLLLVRYLGPLVATPVVLLAHRRPELVHTEWGRRSTAAVGLVLFVLMWVRILNGPVELVAVILGVPLLVPTTLLHFAALAERTYHAPVTS